MYYEQCTEVQSSTPLGCTMNSVLKYSQVHHWGVLMNSVLKYSQVQHWDVLMNSVLKYSRVQQMGCTINLNYCSSKCHCLCPPNVCFSCSSHFLGLLLFLTGSPHLFPRATDLTLHSSPPSPNISGTVYSHSSSFTLSYPVH